MARFYAEAFGYKHARSKPVHRLGHREAHTIAASYSGAVKTSLYVRSDGTECALVELMPWQGSDTRRAVLFDGPIDGSGLKEAVLAA